MLVRSCAGRILGAVVALLPVLVLEAPFSHAASQLVASSTAGSIRAYRGAPRAGLAVPKAVDRSGASTSGKGNVGTSAAVARGGGSTEKSGTIEDASSSRKLRRSHGLAENRDRTTIRHTRALHPAPASLTGFNQVRLKSFSARYGCAKERAIYQVKYEAAVARLAAESANSSTSSQSH